MPSVERYLDTAQQYLKGPLNHLHEDSHLLTSPPRHALHGLTKDFFTINKAASSKQNFE